MQYKKIDKSVLKTITFYLEGDNQNEADINGEKLTFTLQAAFKIWIIKRAFKTSKVINNASKTLLWQKNICGEITFNKKNW